MNESIEELLASGAVVPDRPGSRRLVPAAHSVVVPLEDWQHVIGALKNAKARLPMGAAIGNVSDALSKVEHLQPAPAPSSLAGGEVDAAVKHLTRRLNKPGAFHLGDEPHLRAILAALSPEAPARDDDLLPEGAISGTDDGQTVWLESHTGGAHELGVWGGLSLRFEEADGSHSIRNYVDDALTPRHEAPAPTCQKCGGEVQGWTCQGCGASFRESDAGVLIFDHEAQAEGAGEELYCSFCGDTCECGWLDAEQVARSSAPEAREGEAGWPENDPVYVSAMRVLKGTTGWNERARDLTARMIAKNTHPAAPSADKLRIAGEALEPFARACLDRESQNVKTLPGGASVRVTLAQCRTARQALAALKAEGAK